MLVKKFSWLRALISLTITTVATFALVKITNSAYLSYWIFLVILLVQGCSVFNYISFSRGGFIRKEDIAEGVKFHLKPIQKAREKYANDLQSETLYFYFITDHKHNHLFADVENLTEGYYRKANGRLISDEEIKNYTIRGQGML